MGAPHGAQGQDLLGHVDAVGDGLEAEIAGDPQETAGDLVQPGRFDDALDQIPVELQYVDGEPAAGR